MKKINLRKEKRERNEAYALKYRGSDKREQRKEERNARKEIAKERERLFWEEEHTNRRPWPIGK